MTVKKQTATSTGLTVVIENNSNSKCIYGNYFELVPIYSLILICNIFFYFISCAPIRCNKYEYMLEVKLYNSRDYLKIAPSGHCKVCDSFR